MNQVYKLNETEKTFILNVRKNKPKAKMEEIAAITGFETSQIRSVLIENGKKEKTDRQMSQMDAKYVSRTSDYKGHTIFGIFDSVTDELIISFGLKKAKAIVDQISKVEEFASKPIPNRNWAAID